MATKTEGAARPSLRERFARVNAGQQLRTGAGSVAGILATVVRVVSIIAAAILVLHIVFVMFKGNASNDIVRHVSDWSNNLAGPFKDLFTFQNVKTMTLVNFGVAAIVWVAAGNLLATLIRRFSPNA